MSTLDKPLTQAELIERWRIPTEGRSARAIASTLAHEPEEEHR